MSTRSDDAHDMTGPALMRAIDASRSRLVERTRAMVRLPTENPPSDTTDIVRYLHERLAAVDGVTVSVHVEEPPVANLVARVRGRGPGRRLVFNGHLDTYPAGDRAGWTHNPFSGDVEDGRLYGRGACDMKGGIAASLLAFEILAARRASWDGEVVLTLAGDEESMGMLGTGHLLETVPAAAGEAMICGDVGSPRIARVGEKGMIWLDVHATGKAAHGAHVHRGVNAIDRLAEAMRRLAELRDHPVATPAEVSGTIARAAPVSEPLSGAGESDVMQSVTVNFGRIEGGQTANLVADRATLECDIRLPLGVSVAEIEFAIDERLAALEGIGYEIRRRYEASWTSPSEPVVEAVLAAAREVLGEPVVANMRVGASDARLYRARGIPTVVCGLSPINLGAPDEAVDLDELGSLAAIHLLAAARFLAT